MSGKSFNRREFKTRLLIKNGVSCEEQGELMLILGLAKRSSLYGYYELPYKWNSDIINSLSDEQFYKIDDMSKFGN